ncbi:MAG: hypothetical protein HYU53_08230 [Acidobacteria bacterium]|nr:hypothetical protein [Acidobacteriota bacterium]
MDLTSHKEALLRKRGEILAAGGATKPLQASIDTNTRQGDLADQANGNNEVHIQLKLKQTDATTGSVVIAASPSRRRA